MITVTNKTDRDILVFNNFFSTEIPWDESVSIAETELMGQYELSFRYVTRENSEILTLLRAAEEQAETDKTAAEAEDASPSEATDEAEAEEEEIETLLAHEFAVITTYDISHQTDLVLKEYPVLPTLYSHRKSEALQRIRCRAGKKALTPIRNEFKTQSAKKGFLAKIKLEMIILSALSLFILLTMPSFLLNEPSGKIRIVALLATVFLWFSTFADIHLYRTVRGWSAKDNDDLPTDQDR